MQPTGNVGLAKICFVFCLILSTLVQSELIFVVFEDTVVQSELTVVQSELIVEQAELILVVFELTVD